MEVEEYQPDPAHKEEWEKFYNIYMEQASVQDISDPYYYRAMCIHGLLTGEVQNSKSSPKKPEETPS